jgi:multiple sugar transport system permease protein
MLNSLLVTGLAIPLTLLSASWGGFALAQLGRPTRRLVTLSIALLLVPFTAFWLSRFLLFRWLGWIDSYLALLAPAFMGSSPLFVLLFYAAYRRIPPELFEAARLDGAGPLQGWRQIALPLGKSTSVAISLLTFMLYWNDFINPLLYLKSPRLYTLAVGLQQLQVLDQPNQPLLLAAAVLMTLPALLVYALLQHYLLGDRILGGS